MEKRGYRAGEDSERMVKSQILGPNLASVCGLVPSARLKRLEDREGFVHIRVSGIERIGTCERPLRPSRRANVVAVPESSSLNVGDIPANSSACSQLSACWLS